MANKRYTHKELSKIDWGCTLDVSTENGINRVSFPGAEIVQLGCLQRMAEAQEAMAKNWNQILTDLEWYKRNYKELAERISAANIELVKTKRIKTRYYNQIQKLKGKA